MTFVVGEGGEETVPAAAASAPATPLPRDPGATGDGEVAPTGDRALVSFVVRGIPHVTPRSELPLCHGVMPKPASSVLSSDRKALSEVDAFLSSGEADLAASESALALRALAVAEERSREKAERDWLEVRRKEIEDNASKHAAQVLQEGQKMLAAAREKLKGDTDRRKAEHRTRTAAMRLPCGFGSRRLRTMTLLWTPASLSWMSMMICSANVCTMSL